MLQSVLSDHADVVAFTVHGAMHTGFACASVRRVALLRMGDYLALALAPLSMAPTAGT